MSTTPEQNPFDLGTPQIKGYKTTNTNTSTTPQKKKKYTRVETGVRKGHCALFFGKQIISGECTFTGKKYKDGQVLLEIALMKQI